VGKGFKASGMGMWGLEGLSGKKFCGISVFLETLLYCIMVGSQREGDGKQGEYH